MIIIVGILLFIILGWIIYNTHYVKVQYIDIKLGLQNPVNVIHVTDIHGKTNFLNGRLSTLINTIDSDLVVITGDLVSKNKHFQKVIDEIHKIKQSHILFVPGNYEREVREGFHKRLLSHEEYKQRIEKISRVMTVLDNKEITTIIDQVTVSCYGFDNSIYGKENSNFTQAYSASNIRLLLAHSPDIIDFINQNKITGHLLLTGHTHGGQIRFFNKTLGSYSNFHIGMKEIAPSSFFYISRGLGTTKLPLRLNCFPEIAVFRFY